MHLSPELIHSVFHTFHADRATRDTCNILSPGYKDCNHCSALLPGSSLGHQCSFNHIDNPDYTSSLQAYFKLYPEHAI